jgi:hypothetical protein
VVTTTIGYVGYQFINNDSTVNETPAVIANIVDLAENREFTRAIDEAYALINSKELAEEDTITVVNELVTIVLAAQNPDNAGDTSVSTLYARLFELLADEEYSDLFRSHAVVVIDRVFWETDFNVDYFVNAFDMNGGFTFSEPYTDDKSTILDKYEIAYRVLYDLNEFANNLYPDKQLLGMQVWIVSTSVLSVEPPAELFDEFELYIEEGLVEYNNSQYTIPSTDFQRESLQMTIVSLKLHLAKQYPGRFDFSN